MQRSLKKDRIEGAYLLMNPNQRVNSLNPLLNKDMRLVGNLAWINKLNLPQYNLQISDLQGKRTSKMQCT